MAQIKQNQMMTNKNENISVCCLNYILKKMYAKKAVHTATEVYSNLQRHQALKRLSCCDSDT